MRLSSTTIIPAIAAILALAGCNQPGSPQGRSDLDVKDPVAVVSGYKVAPELINLYAEARTRSSFDSLSAEQKQEVLDEALDLVAIAVDARARGLASDPAVAARIELQSLNVLAQASISGYVEANEVGEEQLMSAYNEQYVDQPKQEYKARHILLKTEEEALAVISELEGGADFAELAKEKSIGPSAGNGGDLGWFSRDAMVKPFGDAVADMEAGTFGKAPVQTQFGYHVILAEGSRIAPPPDFESVKDTVRAGAQQAMIQKFIETKRDQADVQILIDLSAAPEAEEDASPDDQQ